MAHHTGIKIPAAAISAGMYVAYIIHVNGLEIVTEGEVLSTRRTGAARMEVTIMHGKHSALFTNELRSDAYVVLETPFMSADYIEHVAAGLPDFLRPMAEEFGKSLMKRLAAHLDANVKAFLAEPYDG